MFSTAVKYTPVIAGINGNNAIINNVEGDLPCMRSLS